MSAQRNLVAGALGVAIAAGGAVSALREAPEPVAVPPACVSAASDAACYAEVAQALAPYAVTLPEGDVVCFRVHDDTPALTVTVDGLVRAEVASLPACFTGRAAVHPNP